LDCGAAETEAGGVTAEAVEKPKADPWKPEPIREDQVENAVKFLSHPKVRTSPIVHRRSFLEKKGLTGEEIDEAFRRVPVPFLIYSLPWSCEEFFSQLLTVANY
jgi:peroxin-14